MAMYTVSPHGTQPVSYTHLDVYKRQVKGLVGLRDCVQELIDLQMDAAVPDSTCLLYTSSQKLPHRRDAPDPMLWRKSNYEC